MDFLSIFWTFREVKPIIEWLDFENSIESHWNGFFITHSPVLWYKYKITFFYQNHPVFAYYEGQNLNDFIETKNFFIFYASAFALFSFEEIKYFIKTYLTDIWKIKRGDICLDATVPISQVLKGFYGRKQKGASFYNSVGDLETYYIWEKKNTKNRRILIRIYDKIADIMQKQKQELYGHYLLENAVTRIEIEIRTELAQSLDLELLDNQEYLMGIFKQYMKKHTDIFGNLKGDSIRLNSVSKKFDMDSVPTENIIPKRYQNSFLGYAKKIREMGACPVDLLISKGLVSDTTIEDISLFRNSLKIRDIKKIFQ